jgi:predicted transcriptional regulator of viral defense system
MDVKNNLPQIEKLRKLIRDRQGILLTSDLASFNISRTYLTILVRKGEIERVSRGIYRAQDTIGDEMFNFQTRFNASVFSHLTAVSLHGLSDKTPSLFSVSVPVGYHSAALNRSGQRIYYINRSQFDLGIIFMNTPQGNAIRVTNLERTICDIFRSRNRLGSQFVNDVIKKYVVHPGRNINRLYNYTKEFRIQKVFREYIEIIL